MKGWQASAQRDSWIVIDLLHIYGFASCLVVCFASNKSVIPLTDNLPIDGIHYDRTAISERTMVKNNERITQGSTSRRRPQSVVNPCRHHNLHRQA